MTMFSELSRPQRIQFTKLSPSARREARLGLLFISPWIIGFLVFTLIRSWLRWFSVHQPDAHSRGAAQFGLESYQALLQDSQVWSSLSITMKYALLALSIG